MRQGLIAIALAAVAGGLGWMKAGSDDKPVAIPQARPGQSESAPRTIKENVIAYRTDDAAMNAAKDQGRATLPRFRELLAAGTEGTFTVKFPLTQNGATEHIWMQLTDAPEGKFVGLLANDPVNGKRFHMGDQMTVAEKDVEDWMVRTESTIYGGYTARAALKDLPKEEAEKYAPMFQD